MYSAAFFVSQTHFFASILLIWKSDIYYLDQTDSWVVFCNAQSVVGQSSVKSAAMLVAGLPKVELCDYLIYDYGDLHDGWETVTYNNLIIRAIKPNADCVYPINQQRINLSFIYF